MDDILEQFRERIIYALATLGALLLLPFAVNNVLQGRLMLATGTLAICMILIVNALALQRGKPMPIELVYLFPAVIGSLAVAIPTMGVPAVLWTYPAVILFYFVLKRSQALGMNIGLVAVVGSASWQHIGSGVGLRVVITLTLTGMFCHIFLGIIDSLQQRLHALATVDPLTGAFNRRELERTLPLALERARRTDSRATMISIDIDHFKKINDQLGHDVGDTVLREVVQLLQKRLRKVDSLYRLGGEEFLVLLPDTPEAGGVNVAEALRQQIADSGMLSDRRVTISLGVAEWRPIEHISSWLKRCDQSLYLAKQGGRNRVHVDEPVYCLA